MVEQVPNQGCIGLLQDIGLYFESDSTVSCNPVAVDFLDDTLYSVLKPSFLELLLYCNYHNEIY